MDELNVNGAANENTEINVVEQILSGLDFESQEARAAKKALDAAKAKITELNAVYSAANKADNTKKNDATRLAKRLIKEGLSEETIKELLHKEYGRARKPMPTGEARKSHKISEEALAAILAFVNSKPETTARELWGAIDADKQGISLAVKKLVADGKIKAEGNTRQRKYFPVQQ